MVLNTGGIPETVIEIGEYAFYQCQQTRGDLVIPSNVESIGTYAFRDCTFDGVLTLSSLKLKEIKEYTFSGSKLTGKLVLPLNVEKIGDNAFANCSGFTGLTLNENLLSIGEDAFEKCSGFEGNLVIPDKVQTIGMSAFQECEGLQGNLTIGKSVTDLGAWVFTIRNIYNGDRTNFNKIYFKCLVPPSNLTNTFGRLSNSCKLKYVAVPIGCKDAYMRAFSVIEVILLW